MRKHSPKFSCRITPLTPPMLEVVTALAAEEAHSESTHSRAKNSLRDVLGTPTQSDAQASISTAEGTADLQDTADAQGTAAAQGTTNTPKSTNDYTPTDESQTSGGDEGLLDLYALNREVRRLKRQTISQAKQIYKLKVKLKKLSKRVKPVVKHHALWVQSQDLKKRRKKQRKKQRKKVSSVKPGRNKDEGNLSEEHHDDHFVFEDFDATEAVVTPDFKRKIDETKERKKELDLEEIQSTARQSTVTPRTLNFDNEAGPSSPIRPTQQEESEEQFKDDEILADILLNRTRGLSIPGPMQSQPQQPTQTTDPKEKGKGILVEEPKKKKLTLQQIRALETANDEEVARKVQEEWDAEEERKRLEDLKKPKEVKKPKTISKKPTSLAQERTQMMNFLKGQGYKNLKKLRYPQMKELYDKVQESIKDSFKDFIPMGSEKEKQMLQERDAKRLLRKRKATVTEEQPSKKLKLRTETIDELRNYLRIVDFEKSAQDRESLEAISMITEFKVIDSPDGEYLIIYRANTHFRAFDTLWEILHILDRQDLYHLYLVVQDYYKHIPPTGLGLILLGDLTTIWETSATSDDDFWKNQEDWEIIRWRLNESSGVHTLELEDGTMLHMLTERRYPLSRELMIRMLDHGISILHGSIKKVEKRGNVGEPSKDRSGRDDNKRTKTGKVFATTVNPVRRENTAGMLCLGSQAVLPQNGNPEEDLKDYAIIDSGCSGEEVSRKGTIKTSCIDLRSQRCGRKLKFNLYCFSNSCDRSIMLLEKEKKKDVYSLDLRISIPSGGVTCLVAKATKDEAVLWHRRLGHVNFKNINKKGKQHRASCKKIEERTVREPLELLHMDLFGPVSVESVNRKKYCLVVTDDNVADLLTKGFDLARFNFLVVTIESLEALLLRLRGGYE
ncbi:putative ribonuclease H-like domain-containing protein [Tanacetum coccineum]|uniref:Ribonuclease H-like domain-containing protein n=1 Tax=Tanacetum coccineum TaxID=301880 RepID=A0ABQ4YCH9_9ASTR